MKTQMKTHERACCHLLISYTMEAFSTPLGRYSYQALGSLVLYSEENLWSTKGILKTWSLSRDLMDEVTGFCTHHPPWDFYVNPRWMGKPKRSLSIYRDQQYGAGTWAEKKGVWFRRMRKCERKENVTLLFKGNINGQHSPQGEPLVAVPRDRVWLP